MAIVQNKNQGPMAIVHNKKKQGPMTIVHNKKPGANGDCP